MQKNAQRLLVRSLLEGIPLEVKDQKSLQISRSLLSLLSQENLLNLEIGFFAPIIGQEPNLFIEDVFEDTSQSFPYVLNDSEMVFKKENYKNLVKLSLFGREFLSPQKESIEVLPKVVLVPGLAFDGMGNRLGRGKGYFDRYLLDKEIIKIGLCFQEQFIDKVMVNELDVAVDFIVTDKQVVKIQSGK